MRNKFFAEIILFILIDQITKAIFVSRDFFFAWMHFHFVKNYGLSFDLNFGNFINLAIILIALILFAIYEYVSDRPSSIWSALIIAGALSNLIDRIWLSYVRDFWDIGLGFTFNLADAFIFFGLIGLIVGNKPQAVEMPQKTE